MVVDSIDFMKRTAAAVESEFGELVTIEEKGPVGSIDYQVAFIPTNAKAARIVWFVISDTFTISVSPRLEWQSQEWIAYEGDDVAERELSQRWSQDLIHRILDHGAHFVRARSLLPSFLRSSYVMVGDESPGRPYDVLESWDAWR